MVISPEMLIFCPFVVFTGAYHKWAKDEHLWRCSSFAHLWYSLVLTNSILKRIAVLRKLTG